MGKVDYNIRRSTLCIPCPLYCPSCSNTRENIRPYTPRTHGTIHTCLVIPYHAKTPTRLIKYLSSGIGHVDRLSTELSLKTDQSKRKKEKGKKKRVIRMKFEYTTMVPAVYVDVAHTCRCGILRNDGLLIQCLRRSQDGYPYMPSILFLHLVLTHSLRCGEPVSGIICMSTHSKKCSMSKRIIREES